MSAPTTGAPVTDAAAPTTSPARLAVLVAEREITAQLRNRAFIISTLILLLGILAGIVIGSAVSHRSSSPAAAASGHLRFEVDGPRCLRKPRVPRPPVWGPLDLPLQADGVPVKYRPPRTIVRREVEPWPQGALHVGYRALEGAADTLLRLAVEDAKLLPSALAEQIKPVAPDADSARLMAEGIAALGIGKLPWSKAQLQLRDRVQFLRKAEGDEWPDLSDAALASAAATWLAPFLSGKTALAQIGADDLAAALDSLLPWSLRRRLDAEAPTHVTAPSGLQVPIDYDAAQGPTLSIRVQELFGLGTHPAIAGGRVPLTIELLSPAQRPVQVTRDLPGFWRGSYADVKTEMRGRYPRHPWPDDPLHAPPTRRAKRRGE